MSRRLSDFEPATAYSHKSQQCLGMLTRQAVSFLSHSNMAHSLIVRVGAEVRPVCDVIKVFDAIFSYHVPVTETVQMS